MTGIMQGELALYPGRPVIHYADDADTLQLSDVSYMGAPGPLTHKSL